MVLAKAIMSLHKGEIRLLGVKKGGECITMNVQLAFL